MLKNCPSCSEVFAFPVLKGDRNGHLCEHCGERCQASLPASLLFVLPVVLLGNLIVIPLFGLMVALALVFPMAFLYLKFMPLSPVGGINSRDKILWYVVAALVIAQPLILVAGFVLIKNT